MDGGGEGSIDRVPTKGPTSRRHEWIQHPVMNIVEIPHAVVRPDEGWKQCGVAFVRGDIECRTLGKDLSTRSDQFFGVLSRGRMPIPPSDVETVVGAEEG